MGIHTVLIYVRKKFILKVLYFTFPKSSFNHPVLPTHNIKVLNDYAEDLTQRWELFLS